MGGGSGGGGNVGRSGGGGETQSAFDKSLSPEQVARAQSRLAGIIERTIENHVMEKKLSLYEGNSLNFLHDIAMGRTKPLSEKQAAWVKKLADKASEINPALKKSYLHPDVLNKIGIK